MLNILINLSAAQIDQLKNNEKEFIQTILYLLKYAHRIYVG